MATESVILVVDDDAVSRHVLRRTLAEAGLSALSLAGGNEAIAWLSEHVPRALLLDLVMDPPDGYEVLAFLRSRPELREVPVVVLTALDSDDEIARVFAAGADDYVHKPFRPAELVARIRSQTRLREYVDGGRTLLAAVASTSLTTVSA